jgi:hypothetical protein
VSASRPPFSKGTLVAFRQWLTDQEADRRLIERTVALAEQRGGFGSRALRAALDSGPLWGAGRVEEIPVRWTKTRTRGFGYGSEGRILHESQQEELRLRSHELDRGLARTDAVGLESLGEEHQIAVMTDDFVDQDGHDCCGRRGSGNCRPAGPQPACHTILPPDRITTAGHS